MKLKTLLMLFAIALFAASCSDDATGPGKGPDNEPGDTDVNMSDYILISNIVTFTNKVNIDVYSFDSDGGNQKLLFKNQTLIGRGNITKSFIFDNGYYEKNKPKQKIYQYDFASQEIGYTYNGADMVSFDAIPNSDNFLKYQVEDNFLKCYIYNDKGEQVAYLEGADNAEYVVCSNTGKYIFVKKDEYETYVYDLDGRSVSFSGSEGTIYSYTWHPKEEKLIYATKTKEANTIIRTYNFESKESEELLTIDYDATHGLSISPDGTKIAFMDRNWNVKVMDSDGKNIQTLKMNNYPHFIDIYDITPVWSPDSKNIIVRDFSNGVESADYDVDMINIETGTITPFLPNFQIKALYRWVKVK